MSVPRLVSLEFTVADLDPCVRLFGEVLGLEILGPDRHGVLDADIVHVMAGRIIITLLCPTDTGSGVPHSRPYPHLSQVNFTVHHNALGELRSRLESAGAAVVERDQLFFIDPEMVKGMFGEDAAFVFSSDEGNFGEQDE
jgi:hypothetical protein